MSNLIAIVNLKVALINEIDNLSELINLGNRLDCVISFIPQHTFHISHGQHA